MSKTVTTTTPSGLVIDFEPKGHKYFLQIEREGRVEVDGVTKALDVLSKDALSWWGMRIGLKSVIALVNYGDVVPAHLPDGKPCLAIDKDGVWQAATFEELERLTVSRKLDVNNIKEEAGKRGTNVHDAFEQWSVTRKRTPLEKFAADQVAYAEALYKFLDDTNEKLRTQSVEVVVASQEHRFAGRYDFRGVLDVDTRFVTKVYDKSEPKYVMAPAGHLMLDIKTSKDVFVNHALQLEAYEGAGKECGYEPTDYRAVLQLGIDGRYQFRITSRGEESDPSFTDFLAVLYAHRAVAKTNGAIKIPFR